MKKIVKSVVLAGVVAVAGLGIVGCSSGGIGKVAQEKHGLKGAPAWVLGKSGSVGDFEAVGSAPIVGGDLDFARQEAMAAARQSMILKIYAYVDSKYEKTIQTHSELADNKMNHQRVTNSLNQLKQGAANKLPGTSQKEAFVSEKDEYWVLLQMDKNAEEKYRKYIDSATDSMLQSILTAPAN